MGRQLQYFTLVLIAITFTVKSHAQEARGMDTDLKPVKKVDRTKSKVLVEKAEFAEVMRESEDVDSASYDNAARAAIAEEQRLQKEIQRVEQEILAIKEAKEKAKEQAALAQKQLQAQAAKNIESKKRMAQMNKEKLAEEKSLEEVNKQLAAADAEEKGLQEEARKLEMFIKMAQDERKAIFERVQKVKSAVTQERTKQQARLAQYNQYRQKNKDYDARVSAAENRRPAAGTSPAPSASTNAGHAAGERNEAGL